tara:strand:+ start:14 stop:1705 length:1692 start_codon:yes stop_codon:yes gene_type:complete
MSSITGLRPLKGTSLTNTGFIALNNDLNQGTTGQVIKSNGPGQPVSWDNETVHPAQQPLNKGTNVAFSSGATFYDGSVAETINVPPFYDTTYEEGMGIEIDYTAIPEPIISTRTDNFTINAVALGTAPKNLNVLRVPNDLIAGTNITFTGAPPGTNYNGSAPITITSQDTNTEYTGGLGIEIIATDEINARTDGNTTGINTGNNTIEVLRVPNQLRSGANIQMTTSTGLIRTNYEGDEEIIINSVPIEYTAGDGIIVDAADEEISASLDSINNTLDFNGNDEIEVLKVPNQLRQSNNIVMTNSIGGPIANFDGSNIVNISLEESPIIENLTITGGNAFNHIENMNIAFGTETTNLSGLNGALFTNGITGNQTPFQVQGTTYGGFTNSGGGTSSNNGFNSLLSPEPTSRYFVFSGGTFNSNRWIRTRSIQYLIMFGGTVEAYYIQGNSSNGGENADNNEDLVFEVLDASFNVVLPSVNVSLGNTGYIGNIFSLFTYTLTAAQTTGGYYLQFRQTAHSGSAFDNYGIKYIRFNQGASDVRMLNLPTSVPAETGRIWNDGGTLKIV